MFGSWLEKLKSFSRETSRLQWWILLLIGISAGDLLMTVALLHKVPSSYESNPVANWFLHRWDVAGMTIYKFAILAVVIVIAEFVERRRSGCGKFVLLFGCCITAFAIYQGASLYLSSPEDLLD
jgi:putative copper export protein